MKLRSILVIVLGGLIGGSPILVGQAGDKKKDEKKSEERKDVVVNGELIAADLLDTVRTGCFCKIYTYKMIAGRNYQINMNSGFDNYLRLEKDGVQVAADDDSGGGLNAQIIYQAAKTGDHQIIATTFSNNVTGKFTLVVKDITRGAPKGNPQDGKDKPKLDAKGQCEEQQQADPKPAKAIELKLDPARVAAHEGELAATDGQYVVRKTSKLHKTFLYPMQAGSAYRIDLSSDAFDSYLFLEGPDGKGVNENDDNGESQDARIVHSADKTGLHRIIVTSESGKGVGKFKLTVRPASENEVKEAALRARVNDLFTATAAERKEFMQKVLKHLESRGTQLDRGEASLAMQVANLLEYKDEQTAGEAYAAYGKLIARATDPKVAAEAKLMEGAARRLTLIGKEMEIKGKTLDGKEFDLKNLKGKVVLVDFWATWCGPCVGEIPNMRKMHEKYHKQGFEVIGISLDFSKDALDKFVAKEKLPWNSIHDDPKGHSLADYYGVISIPQAILVGPDGRVVSLRARGKELERLLEQILEQKK